MTYQSLISDILSTAFAAMAPNPHIIPLTISLTTVWLDIHRRFWGTAFAITQDATSALLPPKN